jgi:uncharacterized protein YbjT (DUF2867 family)
VETVGRGILLISPGSRGDVQPFVALALGLEAAEHRVTVAARKICVLSSSAPGSASFRWTWISPPSATGLS